MTYVMDTSMVHIRPPTLLDRAATLVAWSLAGALFLTIGWIAMEPDDPLGAVSVLGRRGGFIMLLQAGAIAGVAAGLATVIAGRRLVDAGPFAAAAGLAAVSLRGATAEHLLLRGVETSLSHEQTLAWQFAAEAVGWFVVMLTTLGVSAVVARWCFGETTPPGQSGGETAGDAAITMAGLDVPRLLSKRSGVSGKHQTDPVDGIKHTLAAAAVGLAVMAFLSGGLVSRSIQHGQACFVVVAAVWIGSYLAHRVIPVRSALWSILAVGIMAIIGYAWAGVRPGSDGGAPSIPSSYFLRVLPIQFISFGSLAALATFWSMRTPHDHEIGTEGNG